MEDSKKVFTKYIFTSCALNRLRAFTVEKGKLIKAFSTSAINDLLTYVFDQDVETIITTTHPSLAPVIENLYTNDLFGQCSGYIISSGLLGGWLRKQIAESGKNKLQILREFAERVVDLKFPPSLGGLRPIRYEDFLYAVVKSSERPEALSDRFIPAAMHSAWIPLQFFDFADHISLLYVLANIGDPRWYTFSRKEPVDVIIKLWNISEKGFERVISHPERFHGGSPYFALISCWYHSDTVMEGIRNLEEYGLSGFPNENLVGLGVRDVFIRKAYKILKELGFSGLVDPVYDYFPRLLFQMSKYILGLLCHITEWAVSGYPSELLYPEAFLDTDIEIKAFKEYIGLIRPRILTDEEFANEAFLQERETRRDKKTDPATN